MASTAQSLSPLTSHPLLPPLFFSLSSSVWLLLFPTQMLPAISFDSCPLFVFFPLHFLCIVITVLFLKTLSPILWASHFHRVFLSSSPLTSLATDFFLPHLFKSYPSFLLFHPAFSSCFYSLNLVHSPLSSPFLLLLHQFREIYIHNHGQLLSGGKQRVTVPPVGPSSHCTDMIMGEGNDYFSHNTGQITSICSYICEQSRNGGAVSRSHARTGKSQLGENKL